MATGNAARRNASPIHFPPVVHTKLTWEDNQDLTSLNVTSGLCKSVKTNVSTLKMSPEKMGSLKVMSAPQQGRPPVMNNAQRRDSNKFGSTPNLHQTNAGKSSLGRKSVQNNGNDSTNGERTVNNQAEGKFTLPAIREPPAETPAKTGTISKKGKRKKYKSYSVIKTVKPDNLAQEKEKFMKSDFQHNPQFTYNRPVQSNVLVKHGPASSELLYVAVKILNHTIDTYGSYDQYEKSSGGRILSGEEVMAATRNFLEEENLLDEVKVTVSDDIVSRACLTRVRGQPTLIVQNNCMRYHWISGMLRHEVGTHFIRSYNDRQQPWRKPKKRRALHLLPMNPTEEGLACLHTVLLRPDPRLWRAAMLYYAVHRASELSFCELFEDLGRFVRDPNTRWDYCVRTKRGLTDTSHPGAFTKDQIYLQGACEILKRRNILDFHLLARLGKVSHRDIELLRPLANLDNTKIPSFMEDQDMYRQKLTHILVSNGLSDKDLSHLDI